MACQFAGAECITCEQKELRHDEASFPRPHLKSVWRLDYLMHIQIDASVLGHFTVCAGRHLPWAPGLRFAGVFDTFDVVELPEDDEFNSQFICVFPEMIAFLVRYDMSTHTHIYIYIYQPYNLYFRDANCII